MRDACSLFDEGFLRVICISTCSFSPCRIERFSMPACLPSRDFMKERMVLSGFISTIGGLVTVLAVETCLLRRGFEISRGVACFSRASL